MFETLRSYEPRGAMSCGSPMPRGERIAKPAERATRLAGFVLDTHWALARVLLQGGNVRASDRVLCLLVLGGSIIFAYPRDERLQPTLHAVASIPDLAATASYFESTEASFGL